MNELNITWFPTFRCNLVCSYCAARSYPVVTHGRERNAAEWIRCFASCPRKIGHVVCSGSEPSVYRELPTVLETVHSPLQFDTNIRIHPERWLTPMIREHVRSIQTTLHFHPDSPEAALFWEHLAWLKDNMPSTVALGCTFLLLWRDPPGTAEAVRVRSESMGVPFTLSSFDHTYLWRDRLPVQPGKRQFCRSGADSVVLMPDGAAYRCIGHCHGKAEPLGNVIDTGWSVIHDAPQPCHTLLCTMCDGMERSPVVEVPCEG